MIHGPYFMKWNHFSVPESSQKANPRPLGPSEDLLKKVGREGNLSLEYTRRGGKTILAQSKSNFPLQIFQPIELDEGRCAYSQILNPSGGLVGGDRLHVEARLGEDTHVLLTTPSSTRIYHSESQNAVQSTSLRVGRNAILEWMPDGVIPFSGSRYSQSLSVDLEEGSTCILWDAFSTGRIARGERWAFTFFSNEIRIRWSGEEAVLERYAIEPRKMDPTALALGGSWNYFASLYFVSDRYQDKPSLLRNLYSILDRRPKAIMGGVSSLGCPGLLIRLVALSASDLFVAQSDLWRAIRQDCLKLELPHLRKY